MQHLCSCTHVPAVQGAHGAVPEPGCNKRAVCQKQLLCSCAHLPAVQGAHGAMLEPRCKQAPHFQARRGSPAGQLVPCAAACFASMQRATQSRQRPGWIACFHGFLTVVERAQVAGSVTWLK
eukprot:scaffold84529_cov23-Tisochrysis_lutea.AAC.2